MRIRELTTRGIEKEENLLGMSHSAKELEGIGVERERRRQYGMSYSGSMRRKEATENGLLGEWKVLRVRKRQQRTQELLMGG